MLRVAYASRCDIIHLVECKEIPVESIGKFVYRPNIDPKMFLDLKEDNKLYHPLKE